MRFNKILLAFIISTCLLFATFIAASAPNVTPMVPDDYGYRQDLDNLQGLSMGFGWQNSIESHNPEKIQNSVIVLADGSVRCDHPDLVNTCLPQLAVNFTDDASYADSNDHGNGFASATIGQVNNHTSSYGPAGWLNRVSFVPDKVIRADGSSKSDWLRLVYQHALDLKTKNHLNIRAVVTSVTTQGDSNQAESLRLIRLLASADIALICAAGNGGVDLDNAAVKLYPAAYAATEPNVLAVAAHDTNGALTVNSPFGKNTVGIAALGINVQVLTTADPTNTQTASMSGTSPAAGLVGGIYTATCSYRGNHQMAKCLRRVKKGGVGSIPGVQFGHANFGNAMADFPVTLLTTAAGRLLGLQSVVQLAEPIPNSSFLSSDGRSRLSLFLENVDEPLTPADIAMIKLEDNSGHSVTLSPEFIGEVPSYEWITQVIIRLPAVPQGLSAGDIKVTLVARGTMSTTTVALAN